MVSMCYHYYLLVKTYKDAGETVFNDFVKICDDRDIHQSVLLDFVDWRKYFNRTNADEVSGTIKRLCLSFIIISLKKNVFMPCNKVDFRMSC